MTSTSQRSRATLFSALASRSGQAEEDWKPRKKSWWRGEASRVVAEEAKHLFIVEMGAYRTGEIALTCSFLRPTIGIVTALGSDHLALFGSEAAIDAANAELLAALPKDGHAFLLAENKRSAALQPLSPAPTTMAGTTELADVRLTDVREDAGGLTFSLEETRCALPLHGQHNAGNAALAIACALHLGISAQRIRTLLTEMQPVAHTFSVRTERGVLLLDDTYNISPLSLRAALDWADSRSERPRILLTSGLLETGAEEVRFLRELGAYAQGRVERVLFTTPHGAAAFGEAWNGHVEILAPDSAPAPSRSVLLCVGRMPLSTIQRLLPHP